MFHAQTEKTAKRRRLGAALGLAVCAGLFLAAAKPSPGVVWPTPNKAFMSGEGIAAWAQDTGTGDPHSGLFGCVRDDGHRFHEGIDIKPVSRDRKGEPLDSAFAAMAGRVAYISTIAGNSNYGRYVVLEHPDADVPVYTLYAHLAAIAPGLKVGQNVSAGDTLGRMGHSSSSPFPAERAHLHFEIGLRLTDKFQPWYDSKKFGSKNEHGVYNGMNFIGMDPTAFFEAVRAGKYHGMGTYIRSLPTAFTLRVTTATVPDFVRRYPALVTKPIPTEGLAGWDVDFTWYGLPKQLTPLTAETKGLGKPGAVALVRFNPAQFDDCTCRETLIFNPAKSAVAPRLGSFQDDVIKLLFGFK